MKKQFISHTEHKVMITCKILTALVLALLLFIMTIPSAIALGNESPILPDSDIPETLTRAQLEAHGAVARLRAEEPDEFTFVYLNEDGTRTSYSYGVAVKYEENGEYVDKNNTINDINTKVFLLFNHLSNLPAFLSAFSPINNAIFVTGVTRNLSMIAEIKRMIFLIVLIIFLSVFIIIVLLIFKFII